MATKSSTTKKQVSTTTKGPRMAVLVQQEMPDYIDRHGQRGSENVTSADLVIPRLEIVQGLSPAVKRGDPGFIKGAEAGMLNNSVTRALYGEEVHIIPVYYQMQYLVWRDRKIAKEKRIESDQGFFGAFTDQRDAMARAEQEGGEERAVFVVDTPTHICLLINPDTGNGEEIMVSMPRTKAKISRQWNSMIKLMGGDRFSRAYKVSTVLQKNAQGDFYNYNIEVSGFPSKPLYKQAEELYKIIAAGDRRVMMDVTGMETTGSDEDEDL